MLSGVMCWTPAPLVLLTLGWLFSISLTWHYVRLFHRSRPPARQTVVSDIICFATYLIRLNACISSSLYLLLVVWQQPRPSLLLLSLAVLTWELSLLVLCGLANCLSLIRLSVAHGLTWVHEWSASHLHAVFALISLLHVALVVAVDLYKGNTNSAHFCRSKLNEPFPKQG